MARLGADPIQNSVDGLQMFVCHELGAVATTSNIG